MRTRCGLITDPRLGGCVSAWFLPTGSGSRWVRCWSCRCRPRPSGCRSSRRCSAWRRCRGCRASAAVPAPCDRCAAKGDRSTAARTAPRRSSTCGTDPTCRRTAPIRRSFATSTFNNNSESVFSYLRTPTTWHCPHSPAAAAAIDRCLLPAGPTAANLQQRVCCCWPMLGQTDGRRTNSS